MHLDAKGSASRITDDTSQLSKDARALGYGMIKRLNYHTFINIKGDTHTRSNHAEARAFIDNLMTQEKPEKEYEMELS
jgi:hypothetical protein